MAVRGFFYNSVNKDRLYNGQDMNEDKAPFYKEGVAYGHLQVTADGESMAGTHTSTCTQSIIQPSWNCP
jgi:hypothetical protein